MRKRMKLSTVLPGLAVVVALASGAACIPAGDGTISACRRSDGTVHLIDAEGGATCASGETLVEWNQQGPVGPSGPQGPTGVIDTVVANGMGYNPAASLNKLGVLATVDVPAGAKVHVVATKVVGTVSTSPNAVLDAWVCHRPAGSGPGALVPLGQATTLRMTTRGRTPLTLATVIEGLPAGQHEVGLCGSSPDFTMWNDSDTSQVTAMVLAGP